MPLLGPTDPLPHRPRRVLVAGGSGAGKTTLAARISAVLGLPHVEIDGLFHGPGWVPRPTFADDVRRFVGGPAWVTEWQYRTVREHLADRADLLVWLDLPRRLVMVQVVRRTLVRRLRRQELWNGNREPPLWTFLTDRDHIVRWAWRTHRATAGRVVLAAEHRPGLVVVRLRTRDDVARWVRGPLARTADPDVDRSAMTRAGEVAGEVVGAADGEVVGEVVGAAAGGAAPAPTGEDGHDDGHDGPHPPPSPAGGRLS